MQGEAPICFLYFFLPKKQIGRKKEEWVRHCTAEPRNQVNGQSLSDFFPILTRYKQFAPRDDSSESIILKA